MWYTHIHAGEKIKIKSNCIIGFFRAKEIIGIVKTAFRIGNKNKHKSFDLVHWLRNRTNRSPKKKSRSCLLDS